MTDKPYQGRRGGSYVRASRNEEPRRVDETAAGKTGKTADDTPPEKDASIEATGHEAGSTETAGKPARKRN